MAPFAYSMFCDDIRYEIGGKISLMGIYQGVMVLPSFPVTLPKLGILLSASFPNTKIPQKLTTRVLRDDKVILETNADFDLAEPKEGEFPPGVERQAFFQQTIELPFPSFEAPGLISVRVMADGQEIKAGTLAIRLATQQERSVFGPDSRPPKK